MGLWGFFQVVRDRLQPEFKVRNDSIFVAGKAIRIQKLIAKFILSWGLCSDSNQNVSFLLSNKDKFIGRVDPRKDLCAYPQT